MAKKRPTDAQQFLAGYFASTEEYFDEDRVSDAWKDLSAGLTRHPTNNSTWGDRDRWSFPDGSAVITYTPHFQEQREGWNPAHYEPFWISEGVHNDWLDTRYTNAMELSAAWNVGYDPIFPDAQAPATQSLVYGRRQYRQRVKAESPAPASESTPPSAVTHLAAAVYAQEIT